MARALKDSELFLGLISTVGTDVEEVIKDIRDQLSFYSYETEVISVSRDIISQFETEFTSEWPSEFERISHYMDMGNKIRKDTEDNSILMKGVARQLYLSRASDDNGFPKPRKRVAGMVSI